MNTKSRLLVLAVLLNAGATTVAHAQAPRVTAWEIRRACSPAGGAQTAQMKELCALQIPERDVANPVSWRRWTDWMTQHAGDPSPDVRALAQAFDPAKLAAASVFPDLPAEQQWMIASAYGLDALPASDLGVRHRDLVGEAVRVAGRDVAIQELREGGVPEPIREELRMAALRSAPREVLDQSYHALDGMQKIALDQAVGGHRVARAPAAGQPGLAPVDFAITSMDELGRAARGSAALRQLEANILARMPAAAVEGLSVQAEAVRAGAALESVSIAHVLSAPGLSSQAKQALFRTYVSQSTIAQVVQRLRPDQQQAVIAATQKTAAAMPQAFASINALVSAERQSAILTGTAAFISGRVEQQVQVHLLRNLSRSLCSPTLKPALPSTCAVLSSSSSGALQPALTMLQSSVKSDLRVLPPALMQIAFTEHQARLESAGLLSAAQISLQTAYFIAHALRGQDPRLTLVALGDAALLDGIDLARVPASGVLAELASVYLTRLDATRTGYEVLTGETSFRDELRYMLMALAVNTRAGSTRLPFQPWQAFPTVMWAETQVQQLEALRAQLASAAPSGVAAKRAEYAAAGLRLLEGVLARPELQLPAGAANAREHVLSLRSIASALAAEDYARTAVEMAGLLQQYQNAFPQPVLPEGTLRLMGFATEIAAAPDASGVGAALSRMAGSGTSYVAKRARPTITLNAFGGVLGGRETVDDGAADEKAAFAGPYLPVGVDVGILRIDKVGVLGVFLQAVDLGSLASWRFSDDEEDVESEPELGFSQVFAPGLFGVLHVAGSPLTIGVGWSHTPGLRTASGTGEDDGPRFDASRLGAFIAFDVPLFP